jgi:la-related protein 1
MGSREVLNAMGNEKEEKAGAPVKRLATPWSAVVKSSQASEQSDQSVASEGYSPSNALSIKNSSSAQSLSKAMRSPVESPGSPRQRQAGESDSATSSASKHEGVEGKLDEQQVRGDEVRTNGQSSPKTSKPAWKVPQKPHEAVSVPLPDGAVSWPSLVDSKEPIPKKKLREQAAAAAAAATAAMTAAEKPNNKNRKERKGKSQGNDGKDGEKEGKGKNSKGNRKNKGGHKESASGAQNDESGETRKKGSKGNKHGNQRSSITSQYGLSLGMPYGLQPVMYPPVSPVFYPPAAYGVSPAVMGMQTGGPNVDSVQTAVRNQIDYYFSPANLVKDMYLRGKMDSNGWVELSTVAAFNRVRMLTPDLSIIASSVAVSTVVEASPDGMFLRVKSGWEQWVLPEDQRDPSIKSPSTLSLQTGKNKGQKKTENMKKHDRESQSPRDEDDVFLLDEEHESVAVQSTMSDAEVSRLIVVKPSASRKKKGSGLATGDMKHVINDGLELYGNELRSIAEKSGEENEGGKAVSKPRPVSNGRKNGRPRVNANFYPASLSHSHNSRSSKGSKDAHRPNSVSVGWVLGSTPVDSSAGLMSPSHRVNRPGSYLSSSAPIQKFQHPSYELLEEDGFTQIKYEKFFDRCIAEREEKGVGLSEEMNTLFRFWCYFLRDHFNQAMYDDFKKYALDDSDQGYHYGIECLFRFYSYGLETVFKEDLYSEFENLVLRDHSKGHLYGLEKFWAYHHYTGFPKGCKLRMHPELQKLLQTDFTSLDDFKTKQHKKEKNQH